MKLSLDQVAKLKIMMDSLDKMMEGLRDMSFIVGENKIGFQLSSCAGDAESLAYNISTLISRHGS